MTKELAKKCDEYWKKNTPWWDQVDSMEADIFNHSAKEVHDEFVNYFGDELDKDLEDELRIEAYKEVLAKDSGWFDDADLGYCPDEMVEGWGDVYLVKVDDGYILSDCTHVPAKSHRVYRAC